ncbi:hypothetical protein EYF80_025626 [Liparis tanakae]|uniref:Uncharacterized protein n=1 Tax=Liparis tanakae TaxID=230148 RepID=A0A4Z2HE23_9TELE|nr:hypothetical protein EYF80_025626 [Liparis tanakae]
MERLAAHQFSTYRSSFISLFFILFFILFCRPCSARQRLHGREAETRAHTYSKCSFGGDGVEFCSGISTRPHIPEPPQPAEAQGPVGGCSEDDEGGHFVPRWKAMLPAPCSVNTSSAPITGGVGSVGDDGKRFSRVC